MYVGTFVRNQDLVRGHCLVDSHIQHADLTLNIDGYIRTVSSLASDRIQVCCLEDIYLEPVIPPSTLNYIGNGCEGYSTNIYIASKTDLTSEIDTSLRHKFFVGFNVIYQNMTQYGIWNELKLETLTPDQKDHLRVKLLEFPPMTLDHLGKSIKKIGTSYP